MTDWTLCLDCCNHWVRSLDYKTEGWIIRLIPETLRSEEVLCTSCQGHANIARYWVIWKNQFEEGKE